MEEFINQLYQFIPLTTNLIIKLENELNQIECDIKINEQIIVNKRNLFLNDYKTKEEFLSINLDNYKAIYNNLSSIIRSIREINFKFNNFDYQLLEFKRKNINLIKQKIDNYNQINHNKAIELSVLLDKTKESFKIFENELKSNSEEKADLDTNIILLDDELDNLRKQFNNLEDKFNCLNQAIEEKQYLLTNKGNKLEIKEIKFNKNNKESEQLKERLNNDKLNFSKLKCEIRKLIFEYLNKIKQLDNLTIDKNNKIEEFRNLMNKFNKDSINNLKENKIKLDQQLNDLDKQSTDLDKQSTDLDQLTNDHQANEKEKNEYLKKFKAKKSKNKQIKINLIDKLNSLEQSYDNLIDKLK